VFVELMPPLASHTVLITVATVDDHTLCVNLIPHAMADENSAPSSLPTGDQLDQVHAADES
jgi:riboflavin synthase alpha subunit